MATRGVSSKPLAWLPFAAGGMISAFVLPVVILITTGLVLPSATTYAAAEAFVSNWLGKLVILGIIVPSLWHAAHRLRVTAHDFGLRADSAIAWTVYPAAAVLSALTLVFVLLV